MLMGDESWSIDAVVYKAHASHDEFCAFLAKDIQKDDNPRLIRWCPPKGDEVKVNVDESFLVYDGVMGAGGLCRSSTRKWIAGFTCFAGNGNVLLAELLTIKHGLELAWHLGYRKVVLDSDSLEAVQLLEDVNRFNMYATVGVAIHEMINRSLDIQINHIYREANTCVDFLAKVGSRQNDGMKIRNLPPIGMGSLLLADELGLRLQS